MERSFYRMGVQGHGFPSLHPNKYNYKNKRSICGDFKLRNIMVKKGFFKQETYSLPYIIYMYEDNGTFYEFFSGELIGYRKSVSGGPYSSYDYIERNGYNLGDFAQWVSQMSPISKLSATLFTEEVKEFLPYKEHMAIEMKKLLAAIDTEYKRLIDEKNAKENAINQQEKDHQSWLDGIINNRS